MFPCASLLVLRFIAFLSTNTIQDYMMRWNCVWVMMKIRVQKDSAISHLFTSKLVAADVVVGLPCLAGFKGIPSVRSVAR